MPGNAIPLFSKAGKVQWSNGITAANTAKDGTGTVDTVFTADAVNGSYLQKLVFHPRGTNVASVVRIFINNGLTNATVANNDLFQEVTLPATTLSEVAALQAPQVAINALIPLGYKINVTLGTAVAGGYAVSAWGGDY